MRYDGNFQVAFRAPLAIMRKLPETLEAWVDQLPEDYVNEYVRSDIKEISDIIKNESAKIPETEEMAVLQWKYSSLIALVVLDSINMLAKTFPEMEIAVGVVINFSITDTEDYFTYYSPAGSNTICENRTDDSVWGLDQFIEGGLEGLTALEDTFSVEDYNGKRCEFKMISKRISYSEFEEYLQCINDNDAKALADNSFAYDMAIHERIFICSILIRTPKGEWDFSKFGSLYNPDLDEENAPHKTLEKAFDNEYSFWDFYTSPVYPNECPDEFVKYVFMILLRGKILEIKRKDGRPHFFDEDGNEYFLGKMFDLEEKKQIRCWGFPEEAGWFNFSEPVLHDDQEDFEN